MLPEYQIGPVPQNIILCGIGTQVWDLGPICDTTRNGADGAKKNPTPSDLSRGSTNWKPWARGALRYLWATVADRTPTTPNRPSTISARWTERIKLTRRLRGYAAANPFASRAEPRPIQTLPWPGPRAEIADMTRQALLSEILRLPPEERIELLGEAWDAIAASPEEVLIPEWHVEELERRLADTHPRYVPWTEVRDRRPPQNPVA